MKKVTAFLLVICLLSGSGIHSWADESTQTAEAPQEELSEQPETEETGSEAEPEIQETIFDLLDTADSLNYQVDMAAYYLGDMIAAAAAGDAAAGREAEANRSAAMNARNKYEDIISFDDLYLLARVIFSEAGSYWLSEEFRMCVGEVVLNRVASPEFPDNLHDVVYQKGQYSVVGTPGFESLAPGEECVDIALRLLRGERRMVPSVVYQSDYLQGELFAVYSDMRLGKTYFCVSENIELYPID